MIAKGGVYIHWVSLEARSPGNSNKKAVARTIAQSHAHIWKPDPLDKYPIIVYLQIYWVYLEIYENLISHNRISRDIRYERKLWHPSWAQFMTFLSCFNMCSGTPHDCTPYGGVKNEKTVWRKSIRVTPYIYKYTLMYWEYRSIYIWFCVPILSCLQLTFYCL